MASESSNRVCRGRERRSGRPRNACRATGAGLWEIQMNLARVLGLLLAATMVCGLAGPMPAAAQATAAPPAAAAPADPFGEEVALTERPIVYYAGSGVWDSAFETIAAAFKSVNGALEMHGIKANGAPMVIYTATDDTGFEFMAAVPVAQAPQLPQGDVKAGTSPAGKALKFVHRGSYDAMDVTYEAITNYLDARGLEARDLFIEQYVRDPLTTPEDDLVIEVYVPLR
jgi:effector-binding domain-containing protein